MKSKAPLRVASTAVLTVAWPEIITTGGASLRAFRRSSTSMPSIAGILMSRNTRSGASRSAIASPSGPVAASRQS